ncbi:nitrogenase iron-molybdenum cofactor biosynthesis protein NifN [Mahella sp.]|uniref:nitrogenase iron-molybdenum cofactor biosynthesis protein NifN n=1 Tax=Mahella sp. TaxID=2798721 RepID=UPI0025BD172F|nr:nitrogenase iron-molybdenum cofactor biosynthesis protein NifN [Mahella sp.]MBZ4666129.1 nitrogenase molybdenum-iron protein alpha and beta chain [Mahella sp.]
MTERKNLVVNPVKTCQPLGAVLACLGIHGCMPHSHGSQGCASYLRMQLSRHFREFIPTTTSSFSEAQVVFGGSGNLKQAIRNIIHIYKPQAIGVSTTCSAETIGDDAEGIIAEMRGSGELPEDVVIFTASTPSYKGSHVTGFASMVKSAVDSIAVKGAANDKINIIPGMISPGDIREIKRLLALMGIKAIIMPDISGVLDAPMTGKLKLYQDGGTPLEEIADMANSSITFALGQEASLPAALGLEEKHGVSAEMLPLPIGIENTDRFIMELSRISGKPVPAQLEEERGRLVDMMLDAHAHWYGKKAAIYGDPDIVEGITAMAVGLGIEPLYVLTGTKSNRWEETVKTIAPNAHVINGGDLLTLKDLMKEQPVDIMLGNSHGKFLAKEMDMPLIRVGFPILDRANLQHFPVVGYSGAAWLAERIGNTLLDWKDAHVPDHMLELIM